MGPIVSNSGIEGDICPRSNTKAINLRCILVE